MMARVRLDASHVSKSVTARREKMVRYIRVPQRTFEVHARSDYLLYACEFLEYTVRENIARLLESS